MWELGNTYAIYAQCLALIGELDRARMVLKLGEELVGVLGPAGAGIVAKLGAAAKVVDAARKSAKRRPWGRGR
ncbi:hypothetical protein [Streptomyces sp. NPDC002845]